ncbi:hypothetical protein IB277_03845 [Ensifer sp. ENS07]|uniref:hypothetical protein n=1 Tax=Ensifer sp. ENS07 TaxID=2769274 RepID=UPI00177C165A|nr:hypothetical protein [Ensifer sp. ENS07]MBD9635436.1 hypothetical protein [Ensifer sp. ENS07]
MRIKLIRDIDGFAYKACLTMKAAELAVLDSIKRVFGAGGFTISTGATGIALVGPSCIRNPEALLKDALEDLKRSLAAVHDDDAEYEQRGYEDFPGGRFADAMRGTKSFPSPVRNPYRNEKHHAAWARGYSRAHRELVADFAT